ncbi:PREDICTED: probable F-box protein At1g60180 [Camelina sativa]|uniref:Probable F-box protein At1g60180 n=1 Tax=Camelina sativa TaxID=90675 RepID=A0ABM0VY87_CAMSA|nr:PREDICTED: probable F-box protein At1g60180 [Camelina sativa]
MAHESSTAASSLPSVTTNDRRGGGHRRNMDLISSLPDAILQHILFFVPTQLAITTSVLSRRWRHVWSDTPSLSFDDSYRPQVHAAWINETLDRYTAPKMTKFHFKTTMYHTVADMERWMEFVTSRNVENIFLCVGRSCDYYYYYKIPDFFYTNSSIKQLSFELPRSYMIPSCSVSWTSLKKLSLSNCSLSNETAAKVLCGCPILESLKLDHCPHLRVLDLSKSLGVRTLEIACSRFLTGSMQIVAPHVHSLRMWHNYQLPCALVDVSSLTEAKVNISCHSVGETINGYDLFQFLREILEKLQNAEKLTFGCYILQLTCADGLVFMRPLLCVAEVRGITFPMLKIKALILETQIFQCVIPNYCDDFVGVGGGWRSKDEVSWNRSRWELEAKHVASFVELVLTNAKALDKMVLQLYGDYPSFKFEELVQTLPHNNTVSIVFSTTQNGTHHISGES